MRGFDVDEVVALGESNPSCTLMISLRRDPTFAAFLFGAGRSIDTSDAVFAGQVGIGRGV